MARYATKAPFLDNDGSLLFTRSPNLLGEINSAFQHFADLLEGSDPLSPDGHSITPNLPLDDVTEALMLLLNRQDHLQKGLTSLLVHQTVATIESSASPRARARRLSARGRNAAAWLHNNTACMPDFDFQLAARLRLGLIACNYPPAHCECGASIDTNPTHFLSCTRLKSSLVTHRHDSITGCLVKWIERAGGFVIVEPRGIAHDGRRPDILATLANTTQAIDVTVCDPCCQTHLSAAKTSGGAARSAERRKMTKHSPYAADVGATFAPFALEAYGSFGAHAVKVVQWICGHLKHRSLSYEAVHKEICADISTALQMGNSIIMREGVRRARASRRS